MALNKRIERKAFELLTKSSKQLRLPVNLSKVAKEIGLNVSEENLDSDVSGLLYINEGNAHIGVNKDHSESRKRFTIAHEIGHYVLHRLESNLFVDTKDTQTVMFRKNGNTGGNYLQEREANEFAASLLMPRELVIRELNKIKLELDFGGEMYNPDVIEKLAKKFQVSTQAMNFRMINVMNDYY